MRIALFINGVLPVVLNEILASQGNGASYSYLQPYSGGVIKKLREMIPSPENPIQLYISTSADLSNVSYSAQIVGWFDKRQMTDGEKAGVTDHLSRHQQGEVRLFRGTSEVGEKAVNLTKICNLRRLEPPLPITILTKLDGTPRMARPQSGGFSYVYDIGVAPKASTFLPTSDEEELLRRTREALKAPSLPKPEGQQSPRQVSREALIYERDPVVRAYVLRRANGTCECCNSEAPFLDPNDTPFLEVHHIQPLAMGGADTVENTAAICPNCHRECHYGKNKSALADRLRRHIEKCGFLDDLS